MAEQFVGTYLRTRGGVAVTLGGTADLSEQERAEVRARWRRCSGGSLPLQQRMMATIAAVYGRDVAKCAVVVAAQSARGNNDSWWFTVGGQRFSLIANRDSGIEWIQKDPPFSL